MFHSVEVVSHVVKDASDVEDGDGSLSVVLLLRIAAPVVLEEEEVVVEGLQTFIRILLALGAVLSDELEELEVAVDGKVLTLDDSVLSTISQDALLLIDEGRERRLLSPT